MCTGDCLRDVVICICVRDVVVPIADYYIIAGIVYQAPDLISVINTRLVWSSLSVT